MRTRALLVALIVAATALFALGVTIERSATERHPGTTGESSEGTAHTDEASEAAEGEEAHAEESGAEAAEGTLLGVDLESTPLVVLAVAVSLALALAVWFASGTAAVLAVTGIAMALFAALDVRELVHQLGEAAGSLAVVAGFVALLHGTAALTALRTALTRRPG